MILTSLIWAALAGPAVQEPQGDLLEVARPHVWRIVSERSDFNVAVMADVPEGAGSDRNLWMMVTMTQAGADRVGLPSRQAYSLHEADCSTVRKREVFLARIATDDDPPREYVPPPARVYQEGEPLPPVPIIAAPEPYTASDPTSPAGKALALICGADPSAYPMVEGDWNTVLAGLRARLDGSRP